MYYFSIGLLIGIVVLQYLLSKQENKFLGLILPGINILLSLLAAIGFLLYSVVGDSNGIIAVLAILCMYNIPTIFLLLIYFGARNKIKKTNDIDKMNIQDL